MQNYFKAKFALFAHQREGSAAIIAADILKGEVGALFYEKLPHLKSTLIVTNLTDENLENILEYQPNIKLIFVQQGWVVLRDYVTKQCHKIMAVDDLSSITFVQNWLQVIAALNAAGMPVTIIKPFLRQHHDLIEGLSNHHHRVEHFASINNIDFYDDSKSTVVQATQAAVQKLAALHRPLILILGGLSKGVDRSVLAEFLKQQAAIKKIYCFGKDCADFSSFNYFETLDEIVADVKITAVARDIVLFSPSGASFDLFKDYKQRGKIFQELVLSSMPTVQ
jgi:UDP-N-acetylmuramoylalanine--D-glutamate ligase